MPLMPDLGLAGYSATALVALVVSAFIAGLARGFSGFGAALAGIIQSSQVHTALATYGPFGTELDVIAAVVLGGTSIMGGNGSVARTVLGVLFLGILNSGMNILNIPVDAQLMAKGAIIAVALGLSQLR